MKILFSILKPMTHSLWVIDVHDHVRDVYVLNCGWRSYYPQSLIDSSPSFLPGSLQPILPVNTPVLSDLIISSHFSSNMYYDKLSGYLAWFDSQLNSICRIRHINLPKLVFKIIIHRIKRLNDQKNTKNYFIGWFWAMFIQS